MGHNAKRRTVLPRVRQARGRFCGSPVLRTEGIWEKPIQGMNSLATIARPPGGAARPSAGKVERSEWSRRTESGLRQGRFPSRLRPDYTPANTGGIRAGLRRR
jgi:hypothetical protein